MKLITALSTGGNTSITPTTFEPADPQAAILGFTANTGGATLSSVLMGIGLNQRATFRWVAAPTKEMVVAATQYLGIGIVVQSQTAAYACDATMMWEE